MMNKHMTVEEKVLYLEQRVERLENVVLDFAHLMSDRFGDSESFDIVYGSDRPLTKSEKGRAKNL